MRGTVLRARTEARTSRLGHDGPMLDDNDVTVHLQPAWAREQDGIHSFSYGSVKAGLARTVFGRHDEKAEELAGAALDEWLVGRGTVDKGVAQGPEIQIQGAIWKQLVHNASQLPPPPAED